MERNEEKRQKQELLHRCYWNSRSYGSAIKIKRSWIIGAIIFLCLVTPATNWMIPIVSKAIKTGITVRYGQ